MKEPKTKRKLSAILRWILWVLVVQLILINISAAFYAYHLTHFYDDQSLLNQGRRGNIFAKTWKLFTGPRQVKLPLTATPRYSFDTVHLKTVNGIEIEAWYSRADSLNHGTIILFHGMGGNKSMCVDEAREFHDWGYNVMMVDFRGHGGSEGNDVTIGVRETEEVKLAVDYLHQKGEKSIFLWGNSLGAVVVAKAMADYDLPVSGIIMESPFGSLQSFLKAKARRLGFPQQPFAFLTTFWIGVEKGFSGFRHQTARYARRIHCPVLLQWGTDDDLINQDEIQVIYKAIFSSHKKLVIYDHAVHESFLRKDPVLWRLETLNFLQHP